MKYNDLQYRWWQGATCDYCKNKTRRVAVVSKQHIPIFACSPQHAYRLEREELDRVFDFDDKMQEGRLLKQKIYNLIEPDVARTIPDEIWLQVDNLLAEALYIAECKNDSNKRPKRKST